MRDGLKFCWNDSLYVRTLFRSATGYPGPYPGRELLLRVPLQPPLVVLLLLVMPVLVPTTPASFLGMERSLVSPATPTRRRGVLLVGVDVGGGVESEVMGVAGVLCAGDAGLASRSWILEAACLAAQTVVYMY